MARKTYAMGELERYFRDKGMEARFWQDEADYMLHVLAKPGLGRFATPLNYTVPSWETKRPLWHNCWWARLLRWVNERVFRCTATSKSPFPDWLCNLLYTYQVDLCAKIETLPIDVLERIQVMRHYLTCHRWEEPTKIIIGRKAFNELQDACIQHFPDALTFSQGGGGFHIFGLEVQVNPFVAEDAILVC